MDKKRIESAVEAVCHKGCKRVWVDIETLEKGDVLAEAPTLNAAERAAVLQELKTIMAVYSGNCAVG